MRRARLARLCACRRFPMRTPRWSAKSPMPPNPSLDRSCQSQSDDESYRLGAHRAVGRGDHGTSEFTGCANASLATSSSKRDFVSSRSRRTGRTPPVSIITYAISNIRPRWTAFARFPTWMWRNAEVRDFVNWLRKHNGTVERDKRVAFHGLDLYSLYDSIRSY